MKWNVQTTPYAQNQLANIKDTRIQEQIRKRIRALADDPDKQGKLLGDDLIDLRSVRAVKERYRIIFKVEKEKIVVLVVLVGMRKEGAKKDVYAVAQKLARHGLLDLVTPLISQSTPETEDQLETEEQSETTEE